MKYEKCVKCALSEPHCRAHILWCSKFKYRCEDVKPVNSEKCLSFVTDKEMYTAESTIAH